MRRRGLRLDGIVLLDKPGGLSSNAALQRVKHLLGAAKAGHTGTLDPLATGLLPLCFGEATKFAAGLLDADKDYEALVQLGSATSTGMPRAKSSSGANPPTSHSASIVSWKICAGLSSKSHPCSVPSNIRADHCMSMRARASPSSVRAAQSRSTSSRL